MSLLPVIGKIQERIVFKTLYNYCLDNNLLTWRNSGFKPLDSAMNQLLMVTHKIYMALEHGQDVIMVFLDISKAFDRVWHDGLVHKLNFFGIAGNLLKWLTNYLKDRFQRVVINGANSDWIKILAGVPQGSILGPLLFLIYGNDITLDIHSDIYLYADDTILMKILSDPIVDIQTINSDLDTLNYWAQQWAVSFSPTKSENMVITKKVNRPIYGPVLLDDIVVTKVTSHSHL